MVASRPLNIVYFGTPEFAVPSLTRLLESSHRVVGLVSQPDRPKGRGHRVQVTPTKAMALARGVPVFQPDRLKDPGFLGQLAALEPDLGVVAAYGRILPEVLLAVPHLGMINVHASILPAYRGAAPVHRAVIAGEKETGVTIMRVVRELDAGPTFAMRRRSIGEDETSADVERALAQVGAELLIEVVDLIAAGKAVETPQDDGRATYAPKLTKADGTIDWRQPAHAIHDLVRGLHPWPHAAARLGSTRVLLHRTQEVPANAPEQASASGAAIAGSWAPGAIAAADRDGLLVMCGDGKLLRILEIQPEGKRVMTAREFLAGHAIPPGVLLETA